ncbi:MAG: ribosomal-protein-alanine acetyltransferase [Alphaproteobacteria bacterium]|nr:MAG: ribosomal-protein-alanine acetyltransferase [Alphaproteobacteria bacterium]
MSTLAGPVVSHADARHLDALMDVMRASFDPVYGEAWSALQLGGSLGQTGSFARQAFDRDNAAAGFTLSRAAGPEVELLLIAVRPEHRGRGFGRLLLETACNDSLHRGASDVFLEVRENNLPARALYRRMGFVDVGRRADYYAGSSGDRYAAITMRRRLDDLP